MSGVIHLHGESIAEARRLSRSNSRFYPHSVVFWPGTNRGSFEVGYKDPIQELVVRIGNLLQALKDQSYRLSKKSGPGFRTGVTLVGKPKAGEDEAEGVVEGGVPESVEGPQCKTRYSEPAD
jgi:hypothetical protein